MSESTMNKVLVTLTMHLRFLVFVCLVGWMADWLVGFSCKERVEVKGQKFYEFQLQVILSHAALH